MGPRPVRDLSPTEECCEMAKYLSQEWLDLQKELAQEFPERPGATARMQYRVTGAPEGDVAYYQVIENGKMLENSLGDDDQAEFTISQSYEDSVKILKGELDANAAFMQGRLKVTGNMGKLMSLMPLTQSPEYKAIQKNLADQTEY
jgi:putative sterol carrier protein